MAGRRKLFRETAFKNDVPFSLHFKCKNVKLCNIQDFCNMTVSISSWIYFVTSFGDIICKDMQCTFCSEVKCYWKCDFLWKSANITLILKVFWLATPMWKCVIKINIEWQTVINTKTSVNVKTMSTFNMYPRQRQVEMKVPLVLHVRLSEVPVHPVCWLPLSKKSCPYSVLPPTSCFCIAHKKC